MKRTSLTVGILLAGILWAPALAQNASEGRDKTAPQRKGGKLAPNMAARGQARTNQQMDKLTKELTLNQDQQDKIRKLLTDHQAQRAEQIKARWTPESQEKIENLNKQIEDATNAGDKQKVKTLEAQRSELTGEVETTATREKIENLNKQIADATNAGDKQKVKTLEAQRSELTGEAKMTAAREKLTKDVEAVLTAEQKPKFAEIKDEVFGWQMVSLKDHPEMLMKAVESLKLPAEKEQKIKGIVDEWKTTPKAPKDSEAAKAGTAAVYNKVMAELTPEEQTKVKAWRPMGSMTGHVRGEAQGDGKGFGDQKPGDREITPSASAQLGK